MDDETMAMKERKTKFTASVTERLVCQADERAAKLNVTRSDVVEQALELWLRMQANLEEQKYFEEAAAEMNADAKDWNTLTSQSARKTLE